MRVFLEILQLCFRVVQLPLAVFRKFLSNEEFREITSVLLRHYRMVALPELNEIIKDLKQDKKNEGAQLNFSLLNGIGKCVVRHPGV